MTISVTAEEEQAEEKEVSQTTTIQKHEAKPASGAMRKLIEEAGEEKIPTLER